MIRHIKTLARNLSQSEDGNTAIEYALIISFTALVIVTSVATLGHNLRNVFNSVANGF